MNTTYPPVTRTVGAVRFDQVSRLYPNGPGFVTALDAVTLEIAPGSFTAIMGPSGSGKSSFLNVAAGLDSPSHGRVVVGDTELSGMATDDLTRFRRDHIGFVFQAYNLLNHLTVAENIGLPLVLAGRQPDPQWQNWLIESVGLTGLEDRLPSALSGGQAQRVAIARALISQPIVVFADEPTGALDAHTGEQVLDVLRTTAARLGQTLVLVTHDARAAAIAERVVFLRDGRVNGQIIDPTIASISERLLELGARS
ncbi:MAG TPA: ABC transporter [Microbacterium sp.]|nr:ABC transporter [Microbacterium sp.]